MKRMTKILQDGSVYEMTEKDVTDIKAINRHGKCGGHGYQTQQRGGSCGSMTNVYKTTEEVKLRTGHWWIWNGGCLGRKWQQKLCRVESRWSPTTKAPGDLRNKI